MTPPPPFTPIRTDTELLAAWRGLMGEGGFADSSLWLMFLDEQDRMQPLLVPIEPLPARPDHAFVRSLSRVLAGLVGTDSAASVALLLARPGPTAMEEGDRRWARLLTSELAAYSRWPLHLATRGRVQVFAPDDLIAA